MAELDPRRLEVCLKNHPDAVGISGDLRDTWRQVVSSYRRIAGDERPALLCACPPCQGMSSARSGKGRHDDAQAGSRDERNLLVTVIVEVAKALAPDVIVVENVPAFLTRRVVHPNDHRPVSAANYLISQLNGYSVYPIVTDLADFGIPQSRVRAFVVLVRDTVPGLRNMIARGESPFPAVSHSSVGKPQHVTLRQALRTFGLPSLDARSRDKAVTSLSKGLHSVPIWPSRIYDMVAAIPPGSGRAAWDNNECPGCGHTELDSSAACCSSCGTKLLRPIVEEKGRPRLIRGFKSSYRRMHGNRPAATVTTASGHVGSDYTIHPDENRLLSTLECALLQTFPPRFRWGNALTAVGHTGVRAMIGEAVPPGFTEKHGAILAGLLSNRSTKVRMKADNHRAAMAISRLDAASKKDGRSLRVASLEVA